VRHDGGERRAAPLMHNRWHPNIPPAFSVRPGEAVTLECEDGMAGLITRESVHSDCGQLDLGLAHPLAGPVEVVGAEPGDVLEIVFLEYESADFGVTAVVPGFGFLADLFAEPYLVKWEIAAGLARSAELPGVAVPEEMFAGVVGVAPSAERLEAVLRREQRIAERGGPVAESAPESAAPPDAAGGLRTIPPREIGGNLDIRQLVAGSRIYLPVDVPGALFSIGDLHFAQGDGEVCGTAIEVAGTVTVELHVHRDHARQGRFPSYETPARPGRRSFATTGIPVDDAMDLTVAAREALISMIDHLVATRGLEPAAAYALCSVVVDLRLSEVVDVPYPIVSALLPLDVFEPASP
jgi:formamidase